MWRFQAYDLEILEGSWIIPHLKLIISLLDSNETIIGGYLRPTLSLLEACLKPTYAYLKPTWCLFEEFLKSIRSILEVNYIDWNILFIEYNMWLTHKSWQKSNTIKGSIKIFCTFRLLEGNECKINGNKKPSHYRNHNLAELVQIHPTCLVSP